MPRLDPNPFKELDNCYTPLERQRRESMSLRQVGYGYFRVATKPTDFPKCCKCKKTLYGASTRINGKSYCLKCH